ncbi:MAG TPA: glycoside hydrolase family 127 protein, partial [Armatimonadota bacterium]|nr:glycoside hydrolase family 127 protein [Armatimonadota bacterium]
MASRTGAGAPALLMMCMSLGVPANAAGRGLTPVPLTDVRLTDGFWAPRLEVLRDVTIAHEIRMCEETGRIHNFRAAAGTEPGGFEGIFFNDSDVYKLIEGASYLYAIEGDAARRARIAEQIDPLIDAIAAAQQPDGYIYTFYTLTDPGLRWSDLPSMHELYCMGHLLEAGVAHFQATGSRRLLDVAIRAADCIDSVFGPGKNPGVCGHEEIELALVKLADATGDAKYLRLAEHFINARGYAHTEYDQNHIPVRDQRSVVGHAVRAMYLFCAAADVAARTGDAGLLEATRAIWDDLTFAKMYITGGIGPSGSNEGFTTAYDLPNETAYAETCAAIGLVLLGHRMALVDADARYVDEAERALMNGALSGISLSGDRFFYVNPLGSRNGHQRVDWFGCACCPPNILRVIPQVPGMLYATGERALYVQLYARSEARARVAGQAVALTQETDYPWDGRIRLTVKPDMPAEFVVCLRKPGWCRSWTVRVNGGERPARVSDDGYIHLRERWSGQTITLDLDMPVERVEAHPMVQADVGRVALQRGPLVYCLEGVDNDRHVRDLYLPRDTSLRSEFDGQLLGGVVKVRGTARRAAGEWDRRLYRTAELSGDVPFTAVPYYA